MLLRKNNKPAFTLIELLVVIAIIGLLATLSVVALSNSRARARDSRRVSDIKQIHTALELYFNSNNEYPNSLEDLETAGLMSPVPTAPTPSDGSCSGENNTYSYTKINENDYVLSYCLGSNTGELESGISYASPLYLQSSVSKLLEAGLVGHWTMDSSSYVEGTENYANSVSNGVNTWGGSSWVYEYNDVILGHDRVIKHIKGPDHAGWVMLAHSGRISTANKPLNTEYTLSFWAKPLTSELSSIRIRCELRTATGNTNRYSVISQTFTAEPGWNRYEATAFFPENHPTTGDPIVDIYPIFGIADVNPSTNQELLIAGIQLEAKPEATPYTEGTRQTRLADSTPYGNHGTSDIENSPTLGTDRFGKEVGAMSFNGSSDYVEVGTPRFGTFTMTSWVMVNSYIPNSAVGAVLSDGRRLRFGINSNGNIVNRWSIDGSWTTYTHPEILLFGNWYHIALSYDEIAHKKILYVNGEPEVFYNVKDWDDSDVGIGRIGMQDVNDYFHDGKIDDVRIYNRALSQEEISLLYDSYKPQLQVSSLNSGLVGHWTLDEVDYNPSTNRVNDLTPYSNHGTNYNTTFTTNRFGKSGGAMDFTSNDYIETSFKTSEVFQNNSPFTLSAWIYPKENITANSGIICNQRFQTQESPGGFCMATRNFNQVSLILTKEDEFGTQTFQDIASMSLELNQWQNIAYVYNPEIKTVSAFLNGALVNTTVNNNFNWTTENRNTLIRRNTQGGWGFHFDNILDDLRIYNRALSPQEISQLYNSYKPKVVPSLQRGLVLDMPLTSADYNPSTERVSDRTPYENHGVNNGATVTSEGFELDDNSEYINLGEPDILDFQVNDSFSIGGWFIIEDAYPRWFSWTTPPAWLNTTAGILGRGSSVGHIGIGVSVNWEDTGDVNIEPSLNGIRFRTGRRSGHGVIYTSPYINLNEYYHVYFVYTPGMQYTYINGQLVDSRNNSNFLEEPSLISGDWRIFHFGTVHGGNPRGIKGSASNIRIYNRALSTQEVELLYARGR